jgi:hypothetical protein
VTADAVVVYAEPSPVGHRALRWAAAEARRRRTALHIALPGRAPVDDSSGRAAFADALAAVRNAAPGLAVLEHSRTPLIDTLQTLSADAAIVVVPATLDDLAAVVTRSYAAVAVVPRVTPSPEAEHGPVMLAVAPWTPEHVVELAFEMASQLRVSLLAVRAWTDPVLDLGRLRPERIAEWDRTEQRVHRELDMSLSAWRVIHPNVAVQVATVQDSASELLVTFSHRARLLVLGRSTRGTLLGGIAESPMTALLRAARCPILVVPPDGPPRTTWLPSRERGWAFTAW